MYSCESQSHLGVKETCTTLGCMYPDSEDGVCGQTIPERVVPLCEAAAFFFYLRYVVHFTHPYGVVPLFPRHQSFAICSFRQMTWAAP